MGVPGAKYLASPADKRTMSKVYNEQRHLAELSLTHSLTRRHTRSWTEAHKPLSNKGNNHLNTDMKRLVYLFAIILAAGKVMKALFMLGFKHREIYRNPLGDSVYSPEHNPSHLLYPGLKFVQELSKVYLTRNYWIFKQSNLFQVKPGINIKLL